MATSGKASSSTAAPALLTGFTAVIAAGSVLACQGSSQAPAPSASVARATPKGSPGAPPRPSASRECANGSLGEVRRVVAEILRRGDPDPRQTLGSLHADDLDVIEIVMALEESCTVEIPDSDIEAGVRLTVEQLAGIVDRRVRARGAR